MFSGNLQVLLTSVRSIRLGPQHGTHVGLDRRVARHDVFLTQKRLVTGQGQSLPRPAPAKNMTWTEVRIFEPRK